MKGMFRNQNENLAKFQHDPFVLLRKAWPGSRLLHLIKMSHRDLIRTLGMAMERERNKTNDFVHDFANKMTSA